MIRDSGATRSPWMTMPPSPSLPRIDRDQRASVCVIGAGMAGLSTAYFLTREGTEADRKSVV